MATIMYNIVKKVGRKYGYFGTIESDETKTTKLKAVIETKLNF